MYILHVWGHICALFVVRVVDQKMAPNWGLCVFLKVCVFTNGKILKRLAESKQQSKTHSPVSDPRVPHASVCLCALTVNNNLLYRIKVFAFQKHKLLNHLRPFCWLLYHHTNEL